MTDTAQRYRPRLWIASRGKKYLLFGRYVVGSLLIVGLGRPLSPISISQHRTATGPHSPVTVLLHAARCWPFRRVLAQRIYIRPLEIWTWLILLTLT